MGIFPLCISSAMGTKAQLALTSEAICLALYVGTIALRCPAALPALCPIAIGYQLYSWLSSRASWSVESVEDGLPLIFENRYLTESQEAERRNLEALGLTGFKPEAHKVNLPTTSAFNLAGYVRERQEDKRRSSGPRNSCTK